MWNVAKVKKPLLLIARKSIYVCLVWFIFFFFVGISAVFYAFQYDSIQIQLTMQML